jgi:hypothetical protein
MTARLQTDDLPIWFAELCQIKSPRLADLAASTSVRLKVGALPRQGGVYAFWWTGGAKQGLNRTWQLTEPRVKGKKKRIPVDLDPRILPIDNDRVTPLYVGQTAGSLLKRVGLHLMLGFERRVHRPPTRSGLVRPHTSYCQLRHGIEMLFPGVQETRSLLLENVGISYVVLDGDDNAVNRFFLEILAIGQLHPPFNIEVAR